MKFLLIVNESPWGSSLGTAALRLLRALRADGQEMLAVYFRSEGVYHALSGRNTDSGSPDLHREWLKLAEQGVPMLVCSASAQRRLPDSPQRPFAETGLAQLAELTLAADRVVSL